MSDRADLAYTHTCIYKRLEACSVKACTVPYESGTKRCHRLNLAFAAGQPTVPHRMLQLSVH